MMDYPEAFDDLGLLSTIGELAPTGDQRWIAYYDSEGKSNAFDSIMNQPVADGQTVVVAID